MIGTPTKYGKGIFNIVDYTDEKRIPWELQEVSDFRLKIELIRRNIIRFFMRLKRYGI